MVSAEFPSENERHIYTHTRTLPGVMANRSLFFSLQKIIFQVIHIKMKRRHRNREKLKERGKKCIAAQ